MSIAELQAALHEHADDVLDTGLLGRAAAARRQAVGIRRRRVAATVVAAAVAIPLIGSTLLDADPFDRADKTTDPVDRRPETAVVSSFAGRELIASTVVTGDDEAVLQVAPADGYIELHASCFGVGNRFTMVVTLDDEGEGGAMCEEDQPEISLLAYSLDPGAAASSHTLRVWITPAFPELYDEPPAVPDDIVLTAAVYRVPTPVTRVARQDVFPLEVGDGDEYAFTAKDESEPGSRSLTSTFVADDWVLPELYLSGAGANDVTLIVDGIRQADLNLEDRYRVWVKRYRGPHTITLRIQGTVPDDAVLGVVWRDIVSAEEPREEDR